MKSKTDRERGGVNPGYDVAVVANRSFPFDPGR